MNTLTGRESLIRLVGKRRKFLPNCHSLLSSSIKSPLNPCQDSKDGATRFGAEGPSERRMNGGIEISAASGWVTCPVCGDAICGEDSIINSHLDACLRRGTKRKWRQCTLLQINFCGSTKVKTRLHEEIDVQKSPRSNFACDTSCNLHGCFGAEENDSRPCKSFLDSESVSRNDGSAGNLIGNNRVDLPSSPLVNQLMKYEMSESLNDISRMALKTFIVGRRFGGKIEFNSGQSITLSRDLNNVKDCNAIKVLSADSGDKLLGFLPRELARYLSPLIDKYHLCFQGSVTSVPNCSMDAIPIQILCQFGMPFGENECEDLQEFMSLWKSALCVAKSAENCPPNMARYQKNFTLLLQEVLRNYIHLFSYDEKIFLESFFSLTDDSQRLFIRLYTRKGPWFRMSSICYPEVFDCKQGVEGLSATGFVWLVGCVSELPDSDLKDIVNLLTVSELREILCQLKKKCNFGARKQDFIALLLSSYADGSCPLLPKLVLEKTGTCIQISSRAESLVWRCERLFFLNGEQDLSAFLLVDLGIVRYPTYNCIVSEKIFSGRSDLLAYEEAIEVAQMMDQALDDNNAELVFQCTEISDSRMSNSSPKTTQPSTSGPFVAFFLCFSASWVYSKVVLLGVSFLERGRRYGDAITLLRRLLINFTSDERRGYWTLRLSIDLEHMGCLEESLSVAEKGLLDSCVRAGSRIALQRRVLRLGKPPRRWKIPSFSMSVQRKITEVHVQGRPLNCEVGEKNRFYGEDGEQCGVEELALQYYAGEGGGWLGVHTESGIWLTIFGLLMWDIIFADVSDVFRTRFQTSPLDLETECFYEARQNIIEPVLEKICNGMAEEILIMSWGSHFGTACRGVNWDKHSLSDLRAAVTCIGGPCLASICGHLAQDYRSWSSGMPDLLLWRFQGDYRGEAKVVEVKGPRDRLSEQQRAWLLFLMDCGINVEVCKVGHIPLCT